MMAKSAQPEPDSVKAVEEHDLELQVWHALMAVHGDVFSRLNRALGKEFGITLAKFDVLAQLHRFQEGLTQGLLSRRLKVTDGNVTGLVRRLISDGLISRKILATDRRAFVVQLTPEGAATYHMVKHRHDTMLKQWFASIDTKDMRLLVNLLSAMTQHMQPDTDREAK